MLATRVLQPVHAMVSPSTAICRVGKGVLSLSMAAMPVCLVIAATEAIGLWMKEGERD